MKIPFDSAWRPCFFVVLVPDADGDGFEVDVFRTANESVYQTPRYRHLPTPNSSDHQGQI